MTKHLIEGLSEIYSARGDDAVQGADSIFSIKDGAIVTEDENILEVGPRDLLRHKYPELPRTDMGGRVAIPCFVDPHTHLVWGGERSDEFNKRLHGESYVEIAAAGGGIKSTVRHTRAASHRELTEKAARTLDAMLCHGTGTIEAKSGYGLDMETELKQLDVMDVLSRDHAVDIHQTFLGAHEVPPEYAGKPRAYIDFLNQELLPRVKDRGAVTYVDIFCEKGVFELEDTRRHLEAALDQGFKLRVHADELYPLGGTGLAAELGAVTADHLVHCSEQDRRKMAEAGTMPILLPGTSFFLRARYADAAAFKDVGCAIALSTDYNPGSSHTISQPLMMALACMKMGLTFEESFIAVTLNAAASLGVSNEIGTLEAGKKADIAFLDAPSAMHLVYYWGVNHVSDVLKAGKFVVRNKALVA